MTNRALPAAAALAMLLGGCQPTAPAPADPNATAALGDQDLPLGAPCASGACGDGLICDASTDTAICIGASGISVMPSCTANFEANITLLARDPDAPWIGDGPPPSPTYTVIGRQFTTRYINDRALAVFPNVSSGIYQIVVEGFDSTQTLDEFYYDGGPLLYVAPFDGDCQSTGVEG